MAYLLHHGPADFSRQREMPEDRRWPPHWHGSACPPADVDLFSCQRAYYQRSVARQTARLRRAAGARVRHKSMCEPMGMSPLLMAAHSGEARAPKSIIQEGKKGIRGLMIVFIEIQPVTGFFGEMMTRGKRRVSRYHCWNKVTGEIRVRAESRPNPAEKV